MDPKRLFEGGGSEIELLLVSAGRAARPTRLARWRAGVAFTLANLGLSARLALRPAERRWGAGRWVLIGVTTTALAWGTAHQAREYRERRALALQSTEAAPPAAEGVKRSHARSNEAPTALPAMVEPPPPAPLVEVGKPASVGLAPGTHPSTSRGASAAGPRSITREIEELDRVRRLIASGDSARALDRLDVYGKTFPGGVLRQEAILLRAEALVAAGDRERARRVAQRALVLYPHSAHAQRFQSLADMH